MRIFFLSLGLLTALISPAQAAVRVVATVPALAAIAREVGGDAVEVSTLVLPSQDPHFADPRPSHALTLNRADLLLAVGLGLESGWLPTLQRGARNPAILTGGGGYLECSGAARLKEAQSAPIDRAQGDIHPGGNPHYLIDPENAKRCAKAVADRLVALDPGKGEAYRKGYAAFAAGVDARVAEILAAFAPARGTPIVVFHRSWIYLIDWLGLREVGAVEPKPGIPPTPAHVARLLARMQAEKARVILQESYYPVATSRLLAERSGARLVVVDGGPGPSQTYADYLHGLAGAIRDAAVR